jgi:hypothetical protein
MSEESSSSWMVSPVTAAAAAAVVEVEGSFFVVLVHLANNFTADMVTWEACSKRERKKKQ